jgi:hypothetical protein
MRFEISEVIRSVLMRILTHDNSVSLNFKIHILKSGPVYSAAIFKLDLFEIKPIESTDLCAEQIYVSDTFFDFDDCRFYSEADVWKYIIKKISDLTGVEIEMPGF